MIFVRFFVVYGTAWWILARRVSDRDIFERTVVTIIATHLTAYMTFLVFFLSELPYTAATSVLVYIGLLLLLRLLVNAFGRQDSLIEDNAADQKREIAIWGGLLLFFFVLFFLYSYREGGAGAQYHSYLNLWRFNKETRLCYPDMSSIEYSFQNSPLYFHPLFYTNTLLVSCGVQDISVAIRGFGLVHFMSFLGVVALIHLLIKELTGYTAFSFIVFLLIATWRPHAGYSRYFMPDHNSFVAFFTLAAAYYLLRLGRTSSIRHLWLFLTCVSLGVNNRIWMLAYFAGIVLPFTDVVSKSIWSNRQSFRNWRIVALFGVLILIGIYWTVAIFGVGSKGTPFGVYQGAIENIYNANDLRNYYSPFRLLAGAPEILSNIGRNLLNSFLNPKIGYFLPRYLTIIGFLGTVVFACRFYKESRTWRLLLGFLAALYLTGFMSPPAYNRVYLWLISFLLFFATLGINELYRIVPLAKCTHYKVHYICGIILVLYLNTCGLLYVTWSMAKSKHTYCPGVDHLFGNIRTLMTGKRETARFASEVAKAKPEGTYILHLTPEPGLDIDAFIGGEYFWNNYFFFAGVGGDAEMELLFEGYKRDGEVGPCGLVKANISIIDMPHSFDRLVNRNWTKAQRRVLDQMHDWFANYPDIFEEIAQGYAGRRAYLISHELLTKKFGCDAQTNSSEETSGSLILDITQNGGK